METREYSHIDIKVPAYHNDLLKQVLQIINGDVEIKTLWRVSNINAIDRLGMTDHGIVHFQIVANIALRLARILEKNKVKRQKAKRKRFLIFGENAKILRYISGTF